MSSVLSTGWSPHVIGLKQNEAMIRVAMSAIDRKPSPSLPTDVARLSDGRLDLWVCTRCGYTYDGNAGEPVSQTAPGTPFEALPDDWRCPHCTAEKEYFFH